MIGEISTNDETSLLEHVHQHSIMTIQSRSVLPYQCNQALHTWHKDCIPAAWMLAVPGVRESFKIYCVFYGVTGLLKLRKIRTLKEFRQFLIRLASDIIRSTIFLGSHGILFLPSLCTGRQVFGHLSYNKMYFQIIFTTLPAILMERKSRRGALALYMANLAVEVLFKMAAQRKFITPLFNGEILLFAIASSIYTFILKTTAEHTHNAMLFNTVKWVIGRDECAPSLTIEQRPKPEAKGAIVNFLEKYREQFRHWHLIRNRNHPTCKHRYHCLVHILLGFFKRFSVGVGIQMALHLTKSPLHFLRHPLYFLSTLNKDTLNLGYFFGFYASIYRFVSCLLRNILKYDRPEHGLLAGYLAAFSMLFYKSSALAMYMMAKLIESVYLKLAHEKKMPFIPWFDSILYALSTALVFHAAVVEPQAVRPAYYRFLSRLTGGHISEVNRPMMDCFGACSSKLFPTYKLPIPTR